VRVIRRGECPACGSRMTITEEIDGVSNTLSVHIDISHAEVARDACQEFLSKIQRELRDKSKSLINDVRDEMRRVSDG
jgi:transcriptional regulator NrdR family protein